MQPSLSRKAEEVLPVSEDQSCCIRVTSECAYICACGDSPSKIFKKEVQLPSAQELKTIMLHVLCSYVCHVVLFINI